MVPSWNLSGHINDLTSKKIPLSTSGAARIWRQYLLSGDLGNTLISVDTHLVIL